MYLPQFQEICEKQGWDFKWSDDGESAYITLMTLPNKHLFILTPPTVETVGFPGLRLVNGTIVQSFPDWQVKIG